MDLFSNPLVNNALKNMSKEDLENYKKIGEHMYNNINFEDNKVIINLPPPIEEAVAYIETAIKSGLLPNDLDEDEIFCLENAFGTKWYERYGWSREDVAEPGLSMKVKKEIDDFLTEKINEKKSKK